MLSRSKDKVVPVRHPSEAVPFKGQTGPDEAVSVRLSRSKARQVLSEKQGGPKIQNCPKRNMEETDQC